MHSSLPSALTNSYLLSICGTLLGTHPFGNVIPFPTSKSDRRIRPPTPPMQPAPDPFWGWLIGLVRLALMAIVPLNLYGDMSLVNLFRTADDQKTITLADGSYSTVLLDKHSLLRQWKLDPATMLSYSGVRPFSQCARIRRGSSMFAQVRWISATSAQYFR